MSILRKQDIKKMTDKDRESKLKDLRFELVKGSVTANKANAKTKEIKRAISRLISFSKSQVKTTKEALKQK